MKEFLVKTDSGKFLWTKDASDILADRVIAIPDGAEAAMRYKSGEIEFFKENYAYFWFDKFKEWKSTKNAPKFYESAFIIWQRPTQPEPLPFIDDEPQSLNDQYAEIEQVRQDVINNPNHYTSGGIECLDAMQAMLGRDEFIGFLRGNVFKYNWRYQLKNGVEDLKKAQFYQNKLIELESID